MSALTTTKSSLHSSNNNNNNSTGYTTHKNHSITLFPHSSSSSSSSSSTTNSIDSSSYSTSNNYNLITISAISTTFPILLIIILLIAQIIHQEKIKRKIINVQIFPYFGKFFCCNKTNINKFQNIDETNINMDNNNASVDIPILTEKLETIRTRTVQNWFVRYQICQDKNEYLHQIKYGMSFNSYYNQIISKIVMLGSKPPITKNNEMITDAVSTTIRKSIVVNNNSETINTTNNCLDNKDIKGEDIQIQITEVTYLAYHHLLKNIRTLYMTLLYLIVYLCIGNVSILVFDMLTPCTDIDPNREVSSTGMYYHM